MKQASLEIEKNTQETNQDDQGQRGSKGSGRSPRGVRKKTYVRVIETDIPSDVEKLFNVKGFDLKWVCWRIGGEEDYRGLGRREREGYEFVYEDEVPEDFMRMLRVVDTGSRKGIVTSGDLVLMKIDSDLRASRRRAYESITKQHVDGVSVNVQKKRGFVDGGSKSRISNSPEVSFQE